MENEEKKLQEDKAKAATEAPKEEGKKKKANKTWEAFGKSKGCFIINDPKFLL